MNYLDSVWLRFVELADQSPRPLFAGFIGILTLLICVITITVFAQLRRLRARYRQLATSLEALSALVENNSVHLGLVESNGIHLGNEIRAMALKQPAPNPDQAAAPRESERQWPAAQMREELASLHTDLQETEADLTTNPTDVN